MGVIFPSHPRGVSAAPPKWTPRMTLPFVSDTSGAPHKPLKVLIVKFLYIPPLKDL